MTSDTFKEIYDTVKSSEKHLSVMALCKLSNVSRSGYYRWVSTIENRQNREEQDRLDFETIMKAHNFCGKYKGIRSIYKYLLNIEIAMNIKKIRRLCNKFGLVRQGTFAVSEME